MTLSDEAKEKLRSIGVEPDEVNRRKMHCQKCGTHIATIETEAVGRTLRIDAATKGRVTPNLERPQTFPDQRWFDVHCNRHGLRETLGGDVATAFSDRYSSH